MTLVVEEAKIEELFSLADEMEVELTDIGFFTSDNLLTVSYNGKITASISLDFLHDGVPRKYMEAVWEKPVISNSEIPVFDDYTEILLRLMGRLNICSKEHVIRQYDHEVKGKTIIKPLMGDGDSPQDAAVVRTTFNSFEGIAVSNGILPRYGDIDAYEMSAGSFDEAVRQIISVGGKLPNTSEKDGIFWTVNDNFCVPDSIYDSEKNPDGKLKLAKLVRMCDALYDMSTFFSIPMTSGKDSMKNDFKFGKTKISVPPTILYSMAAKITDVRNTVTSNFKSSGDAIYIIGRTYEELGKTEAAELLNLVYDSVPKVRKEDAYKLYTKVMSANDMKLIQSSHDISDGGLAVCAAECCFGTNFGAKMSIDSIRDISVFSSLFSESHSRFIVSVKAEDKLKFEEHFGDYALELGEVISTPEFEITHAGKVIVKTTIEKLLGAWKKPLEVIQ
jgi:phosphoribosylformylglycinamidine (FGAM) synthase-like enzyme